MPKLTDAYVRSARYAGDGKKPDLRRDTSPDAVAGMSFKILHTGHKSWHLRRTLKTGKRRVWVLPWPEFNVQEARETFHDMANVILRGGDPEPVRRSARRARSGRTLGDLEEALCEARKGLASNTVKNDKVAWKKLLRLIPPDTPLEFLTPGLLKVEITKEKAPTSRTRMQGVLRQAFRLAMDRGWMESDPAADLGFTYKSRPRKTYLDEESLEVVSGFLNSEKNTKQKDLLCVFLYTGLRKGEISSLDWSWVDWQTDTLKIRDHKSRNRTGEDKDLPLSGPTKTILLRLWNDAGCPGKGSVFGYKSPDAISSAWRRLRRKLGIPHVTLHDLRRTFAIEARSIGLPLQEASYLLGHSNTAVTERHYAHPTVEAHREASEKVARSLESKLFPSGPPN